MARLAQVDREIGAFREVSPSDESRTPTASASGRGMESQTLRLIVTVHGIRTFGHWQERLEGLIHEVSPQIYVVHYKFGYFSVLAYLVPPLRWLIIRRFRRALLDHVDRLCPNTLAIVAHSFGTHIVASALKGISKGRIPVVDLIIFAGSVLKSNFRWQELIPSRVRSVVNECGIADSVLLWNQLFVLFTGMAGRLGFAGLTGSHFRNRFHRFGHSGYFAGTHDDTPDFMQRHWVPLLTAPNLSDVVCTAIDERHSCLSRGLEAFFLNNIEPVKMAVYLGPAIAAILWINGMRLSEREARVRADGLSANLQQSNSRLRTALRRQSEARAAADRAASDLRKANNALETALQNEAFQRRRAALGEAEARSEKNIAEQRADETVVANLTLQSELAQSSSPRESLRLALEASRRSATPATSRRLFQAILAARPATEIAHSGAPVVFMNWIEDALLFVARENGEVSTYAFGAQKPKTLTVGPGVKLISGCSERTKTVLISDAGHIYVFDPAVDTHGTPLTEWKSQSEPRLGCFADPSSPWVVTFDSAKHAFAWDIASGHLVGTATLKPAPVTASAFIRTGAFLFGHDDGTIEEWRVIDDSIATVATLPRPILTLCSEPLGDRVFAAAGGEGHILDSRYHAALGAQMITGGIVNAQWLVSDEIVSIDERGNVAVHDKNGQLVSSMGNPDADQAWAQRMISSFMGTDELLKELRRYVVAPLMYGVDLVAVSGGVRAWETHEAQPVAFFGSERRRPAMVAASTTRVGLAFADGALFVWDPLVRGLQAPLLHSAVPEPVTWSPDGKYLGIADSSPQSSRFGIWDSEGRELYEGKRGLPLTQIAWHPFRDEVYLISRGCGILRLQYSNGFQNINEEEIIKPQFDSACYATWSPDGQTLALSPFLASTIMLWSRDSLKLEMPKLDPKRYLAAHCAPQWFADSKSVLALGNRDHIILGSTGSVRRWVAKDEPTIVEAGVTYRLLVEKDGETNPQWRLHKAEASDVLLSREQWQDCNYLSWNDNATAAGCAKDSQIQLIGKKVTSHIDLDSSVFGLSWSPDGARLLVNATDKFTILAANGSESYSIPHETSSPVRTGTWHPSGTMVALSWSGRAETELWPGSLEGLRSLGRDRLRNAGVELSTKSGEYLSANDPRVIDSHQR